MAGNKGTIFEMPHFQMGFLEIGTTDATWLKEEYVYKL